MTGVQTCALPICEYNGQILNKLGYPIEGVNVSLIKLNNKLVVEEAGKPLTSGLFKDRYNDSIIQQMETIGYTIIKTVKSNNKGIWLIRTEETPDPLLTILKMDGQVWSKTDNMGFISSSTHLILSPEAFRLSQKRLLDLHPLYLLVVVAKSSF